jgi:hypothetical protein
VANVQQEETNILMLMALRKIYISRTEERGFFKAQALPICLRYQADLSSKVELLLATWRGFFIIRAVNSDLMG